MGGGRLGLGVGMDICELIQIKLYYITPTSAN